MVSAEQMGRRIGKSVSNTVTGAEVVVMVQSRLVHSGLGEPRVGANAVCIGTKAAAVAAARCGSTHILGQVRLMSSAHTRRLRTMGLEALRMF
eukprot:366205-Chlamydomonas_euryale.AAC.2